MLRGGPISKAIDKLQILSKYFGPEFVFIILYEFLYSTCCRMEDNYAMNGQVRDRLKNGLTENWVGRNLEGRLGVGLKAICKKKNWKKIPVHTVSVSACFSYSKFAPCQSLVVLAHAILLTSCQKLC